MDNSMFFDIISSNYDEMIDITNSLNNKSKTFKNFISNKDKTALDLGCGTGIDSLTLFKLGLTVDAVDHSIGMLNKARINANKINATINFINSSLSQLDIKNKTYDVILSLGNTIANIDNYNLQKLLEKLYNYVSLNGKIIIQIINYASLPSSGIYNLNEYENDALKIVRKYEINNYDIDFIVENTNLKTKETEKIITTLFPHSKSDFQTIANELNLKCTFYGNLNKDPYIITKSNNLVVELQK